MKETFRRRAYIRALTRHYYVDPILFREGWYKSRDEAARLYLVAAACLRRGELLPHVAPCYLWPAPPSA